MMGGIAGEINRARRPFCLADCFAVEVGGETIKRTTIRFRSASALNGRLLWLNGRRRQGRAGVGHGSMGRGFARRDRGKWLALNLLPDEECSASQDQAQRAPQHAIANRREDRLQARKRRQ
jgi:hypothetical protein